MKRLILFLAQGFGSGLAPRAPGTFGSLVGIAWFLLLLVPASLPLFVAGTLGAIGLAVWACGEAEQILGQHDPGSVVLDEIVAMPLCFLPQLVAQTHAQGGRFPGPGDFLHGWPGWLLPLGFVAFRIFDIWKPWPIRQLQRLPGGWGVVVDDLLAAGWVNVLGVLMVQ